MYELYIYSVDVVFSQSVSMSLVCCVMSTLCGRAQCGLIAVDTR
jgi:hypothetical protein